MRIKTIFLVFLFLLSYFSIAQAEMLSIKGNDINMRSGPGKNYKVLWELGDGFPLKLLKRRGNWNQVSDFEGSVGWVHKSVLDQANHMIVKVHRKTRKRINVRSGPGLKYRVIAKAYYGVVFETVKQGNGWVKIKHEKGVNGWVKRSLLWGW